MSFFDDADQPYSVEDVITSVIDQEQQEAEDMEEADRRFEVAALLRQVLKGGTFFSGDSPAVRVVNEKFRVFAKEQMNELIGLGSPTSKEPVVSSPFDPQEVAALKSVAARLMAAGTPKAEGTLNVVTPQISTTPAMIVRPVVEQPQMIVRPTTKEPPKPKASVEPKVVNPTVKAAGPTPRQPIRKRNEVLSIEETENGEKITTGLVNGRLKREYKNSKGKVVNVQDLTPQTPHPQTIPMPQGSNMTQVSQQSAINGLPSEATATLGPAPREN